MATVSILIPAYRPDYLGRALISARRQTFADIEILVGDDTPGGELAPIVNEQGDVRIRYFHFGFDDKARTARTLWALARGKYVKWLADEDMLMPTSVEVLVDALQQHPEAALAFHGRVIVDENDNVLHAPPALLKVGERALIGRELLVKDMLAQMNNFVGERSNVLIERERASEADLFAYRSIKLDFLTDVATYLNLAARGPLVAVGGYWSMLRRDPKAISPETTPAYSAGLYEWEVMVRGEAATGALSGTALSGAAQRLGQYYANYADRLPEIKRLQANLSDFQTCAPHELFESSRFRFDLEHAQGCVAMRIAQNTGAQGHPADEPERAAPAQFDRPAAPLARSEINVQPHGRAARLAELSARPIRIVCATRCRQEDFLRDTALGRSLAAHRYTQAPELLLFAENSTGLPALYNAAIEQVASSPAILVFVHDDVSISDYFWMERVREALAQFDVVGLAGNMRRLPRQPAWAFATADMQWDAPEYLSGAVGHGKVFPCGVSRFGPAGLECKLLDGLMLVADSARLNESGVRFDEQFDFHFYDMDFCRQAERKGLKMGTWPISVVHESPGAFNTPPWRAAYDRYLRKYGD
jgi:hypothetical protein